MVSSINAQVSARERLLKSSAGHKITSHSPGSTSYRTGSEAGAAIAVVAEDAIYGQAPALPLGMGAEAIELLVSCLGLGLALGRDPGVDGYLYGDSPPLCRSEWRPGGRPDARHAWTGAAGRPGPTAALLPGG